MFLYGRNGRVAHSDGPVFGLVFLRLLRVAQNPALARSQANGVVQRSTLLEEGRRLRTGEGFG